MAHGQANAGGKNPMEITMDVVKLLTDYGAIHDLSEIGPVMNPIMTSVSGIVSVNPNMIDPVLSVLKIMLQTSRPILTDVPNQLNQIASFLTSGETGKKSSGTPAPVAAQMPTPSVSHSPAPQKHAAPTHQPAPAYTPPAAMPPPESFQGGGHSQGGGHPQGGGGGVKEPSFGGGGFNQHLRPPNETGQRPAVPIRDSVHPDYVVCLEDGRKMKMLKRHIHSTYGMTPDQYRIKWGLPSDYPMVAPNYAKQKSEHAFNIRLGSSRKRKKEAAMAAQRELAAENA